MRDNEPDLPGQHLTLPALNGSPSYVRGSPGIGREDDSISPPIGTWTVTHKSTPPMRQGSKASAVGSAAALKQATGLTPNALSRLAAGSLDSPTVRRVSLEHGRAGAGRMGGRDSVGRLERCARSQPACRRHAPL